ncbi:MAG: hypothetical protein AB8B85_02540 [Paracoccaceae bacterium]
MKQIVLTMLIGLCVAVPVSAAERGSGIEDRPSVGEPLRFRNADGGAFQPRELVVLLPGRTLRAGLPEAALNARSEDRVDLSGTPLVGVLFPQTLSPSDASEGIVLGDVYRNGSQLVIAADAEPTFQSSPVVLTSNLPRLGAVSYTVGRLQFRDGVSLQRPGGAPIGTAYMLDGQLVIAAKGGGPAFPSVESLFKGLFN